jgi:starch synthase
MLKILFASSEVQPLMKTGGLADVSGALPVALKNLRHDVRIIMPAYGDIFKKTKHAQRIAAIDLPGIAGEISILKKKLPGTGVDVYLVDYPPAFQRSGNPYVNTEGQPWRDNAERFALFCRSVCEVAQDRAGLNWQPDVVHCNDWQTGLAPALLQLETARPATVFTIHNMAYQGLFPREIFDVLGLADQLWSPEALEFHNQLSFIKGGIVFADRINTVSPRYAREIQTAEFGYGLEGLLKHRGNKLSGILNGIDDTAWNPADDPHLKSTYSIDTIAQKKPNKLALQTAFDLPVDPDVMLLGFIGRLVGQKGVDLIISLIPQLDHLPVQLIVLGTGDHKLERTLKELASQHSGAVKCHIGYDETLSHQIEAGCDVFLMPSRFEPCGLNQLYSLRYGTVPIVNNVGGLADSVTDLNDQHSNLDIATGFIMRQTSGTALYDQIVKAITVYENQDKWSRLMRNGMSMDFSWTRSAADYVSLYETALLDQARASKP